MAFDIDAFKSYLENQYKGPLYFFEININCTIRQVLVFIAPDFNNWLLTISVLPEVSKSLQQTVYDP